MIYQWPTDHKNDYTRFPFNHDLSDLQFQVFRKLRRAL